MKCKRNRCQRSIHRAGLCKPHYVTSTDHGYYPDLGEVRAHLQALRDAGHSWRAIADAIGVAPNGGTPRRIWGGTAQRVRVDTARRILAVKVETQTARATKSQIVCSVGSRRRLQALAVNGWTQDELARRLGMRKQEVNRITRVEGRGITRRHADAISALFDELQLQIGPSHRARAAALRRGWVSPLAWDEDRIDDPAATPASAVRKRRDELLEDIAERRNVVRQLTDYGLSAGQIAERVGVTERQVVRYRAADREAS